MIQHDVGLESVLFDKAVSLRPSMVVTKAFRPVEEHVNTHFAEY
jgi:hypothetical protein